MKKEDFRPGEVRLDVRRSGRTFESEATCDLAASAATVWQTITDYDALPRFMPGIRVCRVIERAAAGRGLEDLVVEQRGEFRFLWFEQRLTVQLAIRHEGRRIAHARATKFELGVLKGRALDAFEGRYEIEPAAGRVRLHYRSLIVSRFPPPPGIGSVAVRQNLATQLEAVAAEIARRSGAAGAVGGG
jgi:hypothetical protein